MPIDSISNSNYLPVPLLNNLAGALSIDQSQSVGSIEVWTIATSALV